MAAPADAELEGSQPQSAEEHERICRQLKRKRPLFLQMLSLFASFREAARALPALFVRGEVDTTGPLVGEMLAALEQSVRAWASLRELSDHVATPRGVARPATPSTI